MDQAQTTPSRMQGSAVPSGACRAPSNRAQLLQLEYCIALGSNVEPERHVPEALGLLGTLGRVEAVSGVFRTAPVGLAGQPDFHNLVLRLSTSLSPLFLLERC